jgi:hypothetical protein
MAFWLGGFTFYTGIVIPLLHESFATTEVGMVTARATRVLNLIGCVTVALWLLSISLEAKSARLPLRRVRITGLAATSALLLTLFVLHAVMSRHLTSGELSKLHPLHRVYLAVSTAQWGVNLVLLALTQLGARPVEKIQEAPPMA